MALTAEPQARHAPQQLTRRQRLRPAEHAMNVRPCHHLHRLAPTADNPDARVYQRHQPGRRAFAPVLALTGAAAASAKGSILWLAARLQQHTSDVASARNHTAKSSSAAAEGPHLQLIIAGRVLAGGVLAHQLLEAVQCHAGHGRQQPARLRGQRVRHTVQHGLLVGGVVVGAVAELDLHQEAFWTVNRHLQGARKQNRASTSSSS